MWSAAAVYQATRIFASNLNAKMAQRFYNLVLLPRIRDDIVEFKRLNFHLYMALRKALFKPAAFFKVIHSYILQIIKFHLNKLLKIKRVFYCHYANLVIVH